MNTISSADGFSELAALSPLDGRYAAKTASLRPIFSELALIQQRVHVEIEWLIALSEAEAIDEVPGFSAEDERELRRIADDFDESDARRVKDIEKKTNHDVKAVEYFLKEKVSDRPGIQPVSEFIHFACTSEDINNLAYGLMLQRAW